MSIFSAFFSSSILFLSLLRISTIFDVLWLQITINRVKTLPQSFNSSMGQLLLIGSHFGSQGGGVYWGPKKDHDFLTLPNIK